MKDFLRSLLVPPRPAATPPKAPAARKPSQQRPPAGDARWAGALDGRPAATILRDMIRAKLDDPDYARRFAEGLRRMLRDGNRQA